MPNIRSQEVLKGLAHIFYDVVPSKYKSYCALTSFITQQVLWKFGYQSEVLPCQLSLAVPNEVFVFGFIDPPPENQWNGHAICAADGYLFDAALIHAKKFSDQIPDCITAPLAPKFATAIGRVTLSHTTIMALWWLPPPPGFDTRLPDEPIALIEEYSERLYRRLN